MSEPKPNEAHPLSRLAILRIVSGALAYEVNPKTTNGRPAYGAYADEIDGIAVRLDEIRRDLGATLQVP